MALSKVPWNKDKGMSLEEKKAKRAEYYQKNKKHILEKATASYWKNKEYKQDYNRWKAIKTKYNLTKDEWLKLFNKQEGKCQICKRPSHTLKTGLVVDHCHETHKVRALLCQYCNIAMGIVDNLNLLAAALEYKREFK